MGIVDESMVVAKKQNLINIVWLLKNLLIAHIGPPLPVQLLSQWTHCLTGLNLWLVVKFAGPALRGLDGLLAGSPDPALVAAGLLQVGELLWQSIGLDYR